MKNKTEDKTNVCRLLDAKNIDYRYQQIDLQEAVSGVKMAGLLGLDKDRVFKTLVTEGRSGNHYVFVIPVDCELNLKKAASAVEEKSIEMIAQKMLLPLTGYVHGGCSPIGMKKFFTTVIDESAQLFDNIYFSAGRIGCQIEMDPRDLKKIIDIKFDDVT